MKKVSITVAMLGLGIGAFGQPVQQRKPVSPFDLGSQTRSGGPTLVPGASVGWSPCTESPEALAAEVDKSLSWLREEMAQVTIMYHDKDGYGRALCMVKIKNSKTFKIEYADQTAEKIRGKGVERGLSKVTALADGKRLGFEVMGHGYTNAQPVATAKFQSTSSLTDWPGKFPKLIFSAVVGGHPFGNLVAAVRNTSGVKILVEERRFDFKGQILHHKLLTIKRVTASGGPLIIQATIDASHNLPVTINAMGGPSEKSALTVKWSAQWGAPRSGHLNPNDFKIPGPTKVVTR